LTDTITIRPLAGPFEAKVRPPGSKSLTNRALLLAALADGESELHGTLDADDPDRMREALQTIGFEVSHDSTSHITRIKGLGGRFPDGDADLFLGNAGTAYRFATAACCLGSGTYTLDGIARMRERPIQQLVDPLRELGANIQYLDKQGYPPLQIQGGKLNGGELIMQPTLSSQYISALLQIAPFCENELTLAFEGPITSRPYVQMTLSMMSQFGVDAEVDPGFSRITVPRTPYQAGKYDIEPDASAASYFLAAAAVVPGSRCTIEGLGFRSVQGDAGFALLLQRMGAAVVCEPNQTTVIGLTDGERLSGVDVDLNDMPDMAQTLAAIALFCDGPTTMRNIGNLRVKETDRIAALQNELSKLGATVDVDGDDMTITPPTDNCITADPDTIIETYDDHRMAMSFAVIGLAARELSSGLTINDPACVNKTFPEFFNVIAELRGANGG